jgi:hypothetical protein
MSLEEIMNNHKAKQCPQCGEQICWFCERCPDCEEHAHWCQVMLDTQGDEQNDRREDR